MLKKLFRHEFRSKGGVLLLFCEIMMIATVLMCIASLINKYAANAVSRIIYGIVGGCFFATIVILVVTWFIYLCVHFYRTMYSAQGYLTHTLPVKSSSVLNVKIIVSEIQLVIVVAAVLIFIVIAGIVNDGIAIGELTQSVGALMQSIYEGTGIPGPIFAAFVVVIALIGWLDGLLLFFAGSSIGQLFHRSKGAWGIAASIGLYYVSQIITVIMIACVGGFMFVSNTEVYVNSSGGPTAMVVYPVMGGIIAMLAFWAVVYYIISRVIVSKHLNLE